MANMTIAQALRRIKKIKGRLAELKSRASQCVSYEVGKKPVFDFKATRDEIAKAKDELVRLEAALAVANADANIAFEGRAMTLTEAVRRLQELKDDMSWLPQLRIQEGTLRDPGIEWDPDRERQIRVMREVTWATELKELDRVTEVESLQDRFERLNDLIEQTNHRTVVGFVAAEADTST